MNNTMRNLTLSAAALAALMAVAPNASADDRGRGRSGSQRQEFRGHATLGHVNPGQAWRAPGRNFGRPSGRVFVSPARSFSRRGFFAPARVFSGFRFFSYCPGPGYVYIANYGWVVPPFFGAVWAPAHYDIGGFYVEGGWQ
jgi:hypothetical protein